MRFRALAWTRSCMVLSLFVAFPLSCSRDPNVRKQAYLNRGNTYFDKGKYSEATIEYENAIQIDKYFADAHYRLAQSLLRQSDWTGAYRELMNTTELQPENNKAQLDLGNLLLAAKQYNRAADRAKLILDREPSNADAHVLMANVNAALDNVELSLSEMQTAIQLAPDRPSNYLNLGYLQLNAKQSAAAEQSFLKAVSVDSKYIPARLALANFYGREKRWPEAVAQVREAIQLDPKNPTPYAALALLLSNEGKPADAEQVLRDAKQAMPDVPAGYRLLGDYYFSRNDLPRALDEYSALYQEHPKDERAAESYVQLLVLTNQFDVATKANDRILKEHPNSATALILRAQILAAQAHPDQAVQALETAVKEEPQNPGAHYGLGVLLAATGKTEQAVTELETSARLRPNVAQTYRALGALAVRKNDMPLLSQSADALIAAQPASPDGYLMRAGAKLGSADFAGAEEDLKKALAMSPENSRGFTGMGQLRMTEKKYAEADGFFEQALKKNPRDLQALTGLVQIRMGQKQVAQAETRVEQQLAQAPDDSDMYVLLGQVQIAKKDYPAAEKTLSKAAELNPKSEDALLALTITQMALGSTDQALASYQRAVQLAPADVRPYVLLGSLEESKGQWQDAQQQYQKALQVQPDSAAAANDLSYSLLEHGGNTDVALSLAQTARRALPDLPNTADTLALALIQKGMYPRAVDLLQDAVKNSPANAIYRYHLGVAYQKNKDAAHAKEQFERALQLNPPQPLADAIRKALTASAGS